MLFSIFLATAYLFPRFQRLLLVEKLLGPNFNLDALQYHKNVMTTNSPLIHGGNKRSYVLKQACS